jgi:hypothetical protein
MGALAGAAAQLNGATAALAAVAAPAGLAAEGGNSSRALRLALPQLVRACQLGSWLRVVPHARHRRHEGG